jgi:RNA polymerase sigma-70 factor (ECF subfamily)
MKRLETEFLEEVNTCQGMIYHICNIYTDEKEQRKDLYQEILFQLWKSFPNFQKKSKFSTWLYRVALNTAITFYGKQTKRQKIEHAGKEIPDRREERNDNSDQQMEALYRSVGQLGKVDKALILLYLEDKKYEEMAEIMGMTVSNVGVRLNRAKRKLESIMKNETQDI